MPRILIVEDEKPFREAARSYFNGNSDVQAIYAADGISALRALQQRPDGAIVDCFFPYNAAEHDPAAGRQALAKMLASDGIERKTRDILQRIREYAPPDRGLELMLRRFTNELEAGSSSTSSELLQSMEAMIKEKRSASLETMKSFLAERMRKGYSHADPYRALERAMASSPSVQPLGIMLAERAEKSGIPFVLTTSTSRTGLITTPVSRYASARGWKLLDCETGMGSCKAAPEFWEEAYSALAVPAV